MRVLIGCEFSQTITIAFRKRGHEAYSCDIIPCEGGHPEWHIQEDVLKVINQKWDLGIFHPPCTRLCNSGVRWLHERNLWNDLDKACDFFNALKNADISKKCIENPIPHKYAVEKIGRYDQIIQPWQFGHGEIKATCFWLENLPRLRPTNIVAGRKPRCANMPKTPERGKLRSITYQGIANCMASTWG